MIQVIQRAFDVLEHLARSDGRTCRLGDIARAAELNPATCARILGTLLTEGYVEQEGRRQGYRLGPMAYVLAGHAPYRRDLVAAAEPAVRRLADATGETALVAVLQNNTRYTICRVDGRHDIQVSSAVVLREEVYPTATGRLLLAHLPEDRRDDFIARAGLPSADAWPGAHTRSRLLAALQQLRSESTVIVTTPTRIVGIARPIREADRVIAALGLYLPADRFKGAHRQSILKAMETVAENITERISNPREPRPARDMARGSHTKESQP
jgi:DNA-binding IclR family transcriptional regulator